MPSSYNKAVTMKRLKTIAFGLGLVLAGTAFANASPQSTLKANAMVCVTQSGIEATHTGMNVKQLLSLGCTIAPTDLRVDLLPPSKPCDFFLFVAATLPDKILRYWIRRDELGDRALNFAAADVDCRDPE